MDASGQELLVDGSRDGVVRISFNRPHKKNALTPGMYDGLLRALESASQRSDLHALVLTGVGDAFCAGGDVKRMANAPDRLTDAQRRERLLGRTRIVRLLHAFPVPTLAVIRGPVVGAGLSIAMACDIRISGQSGRFRTGFMRVGLSGDFGGHYFFRQAAGGAGASELYLLDEDIDVARAYALGLIHKVVEDGRLEQLEADIVAKWMNAPVDSLRHLKRNLIESRGCSLDDVLQMEAGRHVACVMSPGHKDAIARLNSKTRRDFGQERGVESKLCEGRVVIVTGAGQGLGREYALQLARHGAKVVVNDIGTSRDGYGRDESAAMEVVEAIRLEGGEAVANHDDVSDWQGARQLIENALDVFGRLDGVVNNAGILRDRMLVNMEESDWDDVIRVHLKGTFAPCHHAAAYWRRQHKTGAPVDARLINTTSTSGIFGNVGQSNYGAAKAGIAGFTIITARELKRYGVTVNAISPHAQTRMTEGLRERTEEELSARAPHWVAPAVVWLASSESASFTGRVIEAGGGHLALMEGWHRGPGGEPVEDPRECGRRLLDMFKRVRLNVDMAGKELD